MTSLKIGLVADKTPLAQERGALLQSLYRFSPPEKSDCIVVLGGDGFMLQTLRQYLHLNIPFYGMNAGTIGFLLNAFCEQNLEEQINAAVFENLYPLRIHAETLKGAHIDQIAINEVSLLREHHHAAHIRVSIDGIVRLEKLVGDGILVATPAGSTAYNYSAYGPIIPLGAKLLALTPLAPFRPRRWGGALLPHMSEITFEILSPEKRPVSATADFTEIRNVRKITIHENQNQKIRLLFNKDQKLHDRILQEQFEGA